MSRLRTRLRRAWRRFVAAERLDRRRWRRLTPEQRQAWALLMRQLGLPPTASL